MVDLLINLLASVIAGTAVWLAGKVLRRRRLAREQAFFGLTEGASCLLVASRHASSPRENSVHRRDVAALVELATIARECGARADRVGEAEPAGEIGRQTEFCVGGPLTANPRTAVHLRTILRGVTFAIPDPDAAGEARIAFTVGGTEYARTADTTYVVLARFWGPGRGCPVFLLGGLTAGANLAAARYLAGQHRQLERRYGADRPFCLVLRIVEPAAYGTDFTDVAADVTGVAFEPAPATDPIGPARQPSGQ
ncbi:hypothetical protein [Actinoplanes sp. NPDC026623]|uniref:hypothetical protein n=1 Tax=Actinoplanes sp. NPDC026623 TaxID=3155610 RepID=UPI0033CFCC13